MNISMFYTYISRFIALLLAFMSITVNPGATKNGIIEIPEVPEGFTPAVRFAVCSDIHIREEENQAEQQRFADLINTAYDIADADASYSSLDAVLVAGDFTDGGTEGQMQIYRNIADANLRDGTQLLTILGNHEMYDDSTVVADRFKSIVGVEDEDYHVVINGFHFIGLSYAADTTFLTENKLTWLKEELTAAEADNPDAPIFVMQHPHPFGTVYGSVNWSSAEIYPVLNDFSQVVDFSGHSHYPINDPRSIWQGSFTALGTGTLSYFELELDGSSGQYPRERGKAAQFYIVEADDSNNVRIRCYDLISHEFFGETYYLENLTDTASFPYTYSNRYELSAQAPAFPEDSTVTAAVNESGNTIVTFPAATDDLIVHDFKVNITNADGIPVFTQSMLYDYYFNPAPLTCEYDLGAMELKSGAYTVTVVAQDAYGYVSEPITGTFTVQ